MRVTFVPDGTLQIDNARIVYSDFSGTKFGRGGKSNFTIVIDDMDIVYALREAGWDVKEKPPRDPDDIPFCTMKIVVKFNDFGPFIYLRSGNAVNKLDENEIGRLDNIRFSNVDLDIRPYNWMVNGKSGRTAYLQGMEVTQKISNRFADRYNGSDDLPF